MQKEFLDILTPKGIPVGTSVLQSEIHQKGYYHNTANIWFYTRDGKILLQQRSREKIICPLLWDVSVAGHVDAGETIEDAAVRETGEELGLSISKSDLKKIGVFESFQSYTTGIIDNEFHHTFIAELKVDINKLTPQEEEVEALKLISISEFLDKLEHSKTNNHFIPSCKPHYEAVLKAIKHEIGA